MYFSLKKLPYLQHVLLGSATPILIERCIGRKSRYVHTSDTNSLALKRWRQMSRQPERRKSWRRWWIRLTQEFISSDHDAEPLTGLCGNIFVALRDMKFERMVGARSADKNWRIRDLGCVRWQAVEPGSLWHKARPIPEAPQFRFPGCLRFGRQRVMVLAATLEVG